MSSDDEATMLALALMRYFLELDPISRAKVLDFAEDLARRSKAAPGELPSNTEKLH